MNYDARTKKAIKDALYEAIYQPVNDRYQKQLDEIIHKNSAKCNNLQEFVKHKGEVYSSSSAPHIPPKPVNRVHPDLLCAMEEWQRQVDDLNTHELPYVLGYLNQVLNTSRAFNDYYKLLPHALHRILDKLKEDCPCSTDALSPEEIQELTNKNTVALDRIKQRFLLNYLNGS